MKGEFKNLPSGWKVVRLGEISSRITRRNQDNRCQNVLTISAQSGLISQTDFFNKQVASKDLSSYILLKKGDFAYNKSYSAGYSFGAFKRLNFYDEGVASPLYIYFKFNDDICSDFFEFYFDGGQANRQIKDIVQEGARNHGLLNLSINDFFNIKICMPPLDEQEKIAEILSTWDEAINLTINLIENKKQFKKVLMQNLLTAKIRFPQFQDKWREVKLGEICEIKKGEQLNKNILSNDVGFPVINGGIKPSGYTQKWNTKENTITISEGGNSCGYVNLLKEKFWSGGHCYTLLNLKIDKNFLYQYLKYKQDDIMKLRVGSGLPNIQKNTIENFYIVEPLLKEQEKIAEVLTACDDEINLLNLKLENLKKQKQGLMQKLLSGKVRI